MSHDLPKSYEINVVNSDEYFFLNGIKWNERDRMELKRIKI